MNEGKHLAFGDGLLDLGGAENDLPGLVGQGQRADRRVGEEPVNLSRKAFRNLDVFLQGPGEDVALFGLRDAVLSRRQPNAPPRQPLLEVRDDGSRRGRERNAAIRPWGGSVRVNAQRRKPSAVSLSRSCSAA